MSKRRATKKKQTLAGKKRRKPVAASRRRAKAKAAIKPIVVVARAPAVGTPSELVEGVKRELRAASPFPPADITDDMDLADDLGLTDGLKRGLAGSFQTIARKFKKDARVSLDDCGNLEDVKSAIALVATRAGF